MKKFVIMLALLSMTTFCAVAQSAMRFMSYGFASGVVNNYGRVVWDDWEDSHIPISINVEEGRIRIFSKDEQDYQVVKDLGKSKDDDGESYTMKCMDNDGLICHVRLRRQYLNNVIQLYIEYEDYRWVYNVEQY